MGHVTVTINGRSYKVGCGDGEEARLGQLAEALDRRVERLAMDFGQHGNERLLLMAALLTTDELLEARSRLTDLGQEPQPGELAADERSPAPNNLVRLETSFARTEPITLSAPEAPTPSIDPAAAATPPTDLPRETPATVATGVAEPPASPEPQSTTQPRSSLEARLAMARNGKPQTPPRKGA